MLKEALRESVKNYLAYFFPLRVVTPPPTLTPSAENHFAKKKVSRDDDEEPAKVEDKKVDFTFRQPLSSDLSGQSFLKSHLI